jgi:hypothetical protein
MACDWQIGKKYQQSTGGEINSQEERSNKKELCWVKKRGNSIEYADEVGIHVGIGAIRRQRLVLIPKPCCNQITCLKKKGLPGVSQMSRPRRCKLIDVFDGV